MRFRSLTAPVLALALGGCATYGYVDDGGGYYRGQPSTVYRYQDAYGNPYTSPYYGYSPGMSFGLSYGYPSYYYPYRGGYGYGGRPPYYPVQPRPPRPPRPDHGPGPGPGPGHGHGNGPDRPPPVSGNRPPRPDRAPWRDLERVRDADVSTGPMPRPGYGPRRVSVPQERVPSRPVSMQPRPPRAEMSPSGMQRPPPTMAPRPVQQARTEPAAPRRMERPPTPRQEARARTMKEDSLEP